MPLKGHEKQPKISMVFSWVFYGFAQNLIRFPMKIPLKSFENPVNLPWINSQDFHGFLVHSVSYGEKYYSDYCFLVFLDFADLWLINSSNWQWFRIKVLCQVPHRKHTKNNGKILVAGKRFTQMYRTKHEAINNKKKKRKKRPRASCISEEVKCDYVCFFLFFCFVFFLAKNALKVWSLACLEIR